MSNKKHCNSDEDAKSSGSDSQNMFGSMPSLKNEKSTKEQNVQVPITSTSAPSDASQRIFFPIRLHDIVSDEATDDIIKWLPRVNAFMIVDKGRFANEILPRSFPQSCQFTSFTRKLGRWRFHRVARGPLIGAYHHDLFVQGDREKCYLMTCKGVSPSQPTFAAGSASVPGSMPTLPIDSAGVLAALPAHTTAESSQSNSVSSSSRDQSSSTNATTGISPQLSSLAAINSSASAPEMDSIVQNVPPNFRKAFKNGVQQLAQLDLLIQALQQKLGAKQVAQQGRGVHLVQAKERVNAARLAVLNQMSVEQMSTQDAISLSNALEQHITSSFGGNSQNSIGSNSLGSYQQNGSGMNHPPNGNGH